MKIALTGGKNKLKIPTRKHWWASKAVKNYRSKIWKKKNEVQRSKPSIWVSFSLRISADSERGSREAEKYSRAFDSYMRPRVQNHSKDEQEVDWKSSYIQNV